MRLRRAVPAGVVDAGMASLATFSVSVAAARALSPQDLGAYALVFTAFVLAAVIPAQAVFTPAEVEAARHPDARPHVIGSTLRLGTPVALLSSGLLLPAALLIPGETSSGTLRALLLTAVGVAVLSPIQDHVRRLLHVLHLSWAAAGVSLLHAASTFAALGGLALAGAPPPWLPFGALLVANAVSLPVGLLLLRHRRGPSATLHLGELLRNGRWLLVISTVPAFAGFVSAAVVSWLAGAAALGHAEAARVVAQPVLVVAVGLGAVLGPRSVAAVAGGLHAQRRRLRTSYMGTVLLAALGLAAVVAVDWPGNPIAGLLPNAYVVNGLVALSLLANLVNALAIPLRYELLGMGVVRRAASVEVACGGVQIVASASAAIIGAHARPAAFLAVGGVRLPLLVRTADGAPAASCMALPHKE